MNISIDTAQNVSIAYLQPVSLHGSGTKPGWWTVMFFIPLVNIVFIIMTYHAIAINFGKSAGYTIGMILLPFIFIPMLGLGDAQYNANTTEKN